MEETDPDNKTSLPVRERFEAAKQRQAKAEQDRLSKFKKEHSPNDIVNTTVINQDEENFSSSEELYNDGLKKNISGQDANGSLYNKELNDLGDSSALRTNSIDDSNDAPSQTQNFILQKKKSVSSLWENTLNKNKMLEKKKTKSIRDIVMVEFDPTLHDNNKTAGSRNVKKIIGAWEKLFEQAAATEEQNEEIKKAAIAAARLSDSTLGPLASAEKFTLDDTHIYSISQLLDHVGEFLIKSLNEANNDHFSLSCGVYGDENDTPPVVAYAAAVRTETASNSTIYVALTIKAAPGHENDPAVFGRRKISIFSKGLFNDSILQRDVDLVPANSYGAPSSIIESAAVDTRKYKNTEQNKDIQESNEVQAGRGRSASINNLRSKLGRSNSQHSSNEKIVVAQDIPVTKTVPLTEKNLNNGVADVGSSLFDVPESFYIGDTHHYNVSLLPPTIVEFLTHSIDKEKNGDFQLSCEIYSEKNKQQVVVAAFATAFKNNINAIYISLTIKAVDDQQHNPETLGIKRVVIFAKGLERSIFERLVDLNENLSKNETLNNIHSTVRRASNTSSFGSYVLEDITSHPTSLNSNNDDEHVENEIPESFVVGETRTYNASLLSPGIVAFLAKSLAKQVGDFQLSCGVYTEKGKKPVVSAYATAFENKNKAIYISLTVKAAEGHENNPEVNGIKRVAVFSSGLEGIIFQRLIDLNTNSSIPLPPNLNPNLEVNTTSGKRLLASMSKYTLHDITSSPFPPPPPTEKEDISSNTSNDLTDDPFKASGVSEIPESFVIGGTLTYNVSFLAANIVSFLAKSLAEQDANKNEHLQLSCGIYTERGSKPVIAAYAAAFKNDNKPSSPIYISLTIKAKEGCEKSPDLYGVKRVAIFAAGLEGNIILRLLDLVAANPQINSIEKGKVIVPSLVKAPSKYELNDITADFSNKKTIENRQGYTVSKGNSKGIAEDSGKTEKHKNFDAKIKNFDNKKGENSDSSSSERKKMKKAVSIYESGLVKKRMVKYQQELVETPSSESQIEETVKIASHMVLLEKKIHKASANEIENETDALNDFLDGKSTAINAKNNSDKRIFNDTLSQVDSTSSLQSENSQSIAEKFFIGDTHLYNLSLFSVEDRKFLVKQVTDSKNNFSPLNCGMYCDKIKKLTLLVSACVIQISAVYYIALTIKPSGNEQNADMYGIKKVAVFSKENSRHFLERLVEIIPVNADTNLIPVSIAKGPALTAIVENSSNEESDQDSFDDDDSSVDNAKKANKTVLESSRHLHRLQPFTPEIASFSTSVSNFKNSDSYMAELSNVSDEKRKMKKAVSIYESGLVKKRMVKYQQELVETPASENQIDLLAKQALEIISLASSYEKGNNEESNAVNPLHGASVGVSKAADQRIFKHALLGDSHPASEIFILGDIHLYELTLLSQEDRKVLIKQVNDSKNKYIPINCGKYCDKVKKSQLILHACVVQTPTVPASYFIALVIKPIATELNADMLGIKKIVVFSKESAKHYLERSVDVTAVNTGKNFVPITSFLTTSLKASNLSTISENTSDDEDGDTFQAEAVQLDRNSRPPRPLPSIPDSGDAQKGKVLIDKRLFENKKTGVAQPEKKMKKVLSIMDSGIVKKRIGAFEQVFIQTPATIKQATETAKQALALAQILETPRSSGGFDEDSIEKFLESGKVAEPFVIGSTHIYNVKKLPSSIADYVKQKVLLDLSVNFFRLSCGISSGDRVRKPPLLACAVAVRVDDDVDNPKVFIAITIRIAKGLANDPAVYGPKKISVFTNEVEDNSTILERLFDVIPNTSSSSLFDEAEESEYEPNNVSETGDSPFKNLEMTLDSSKMSTNNTISRKGSDYLDILSTAAFPEGGSGVVDAKTERQHSVGKLKTNGLNLFGAVDVKTPENKVDKKVEQQQKQQIVEKKNMNAGTNNKKNTAENIENKRNVHVLDERPNSDNLVQNDENFDDDEYDDIFKKITGKNTVYASDSDSYTKSLFLRLRSGEVVKEVLSLYAEIFSSKISPTNHLILNEVMAACMLHTACRFCTSFANIEELGADRNFIRQVLLVGSLHATSIIVSEKLMFCVGNLSIIIENRPKLASFGATDIVIKLVQKYGNSSLALAKYGLLSIGNLSAGNISTKSKLTMLGACQIIVNLLQVHGENSIVIVRNALFATANLTSDSEERRAQFMTLGLFESIIHFLQKFGAASAPVSYNGLRVLGNISVTEASTQKLISYGACELVVALMQTHASSNISVAQYGLIAVGNLGNNNDDSKAEFFRLQCPHLVVRIMALYGEKNVVIARNGLFAIANLVNDVHESRRELWKLGTYKIVMELALMHGESSGPLALYSLLCVGNLASDREAKIALTNFSACELVVNLLRKHGEFKVSVTELALRTICNLVMIPENVKKFGLLGACDVINRQLIVHSQNYNVAQYGTLAIACLTMDSDNTNTISHTSCCATMMNILRTYTNVPQLCNTIANHVASAFYNMIVCCKNKSTITRLLELKVKNALNTSIIQNPLVVDYLTKDYTLKVLKTLKNRKNKFVIF